MRASWRCCSAAVQPFRLPSTSSNQEGSKLTKTDKVAREGPLIGCNAACKQEPEERLELHFFHLELSKADGQPCQG